jgi:crotonobetainyl-CoA:carnitine CoA-transferase CaiB-like acyl-CoA transferase
VQSGLFENCAWLVSTHMMQHAVSGKAPEPMSAGKRAWGVYDVFESGDGVRLFIGVVTERQWEIFTTALGEPSSSTPLMPPTTSARPPRQADPAGGALLKKHSIVELERICEEGGLPFARIQTPSDLFDDPHLNAGGMVEMTLPDGTRTKVPGLPIQFGDDRLGLRLPLPAPGQDNDEIIGVGGE